MRITKMLKVCANVAAGWFPDVLMTGGAGAIAYGAAMVYLPAGFIVGGVIAAVGGVILARGSK